MDRRLILSGVLLAIGVLLSTYVKRGQEVPWRALAIVDESVLDESVSIPSLLKELKKRGVYGIALKEESLLDWERKGNGRIVGKTIYAPPAVLEKTKEALSFFYPEELFKVLGKKNMLELPLEPDLYQTTVGFSDERLRLVQESGLRVVLRPANHSFPSRKALERYLESLNQLHPSPYLLFDGDEVLGFASGLPFVAEKMRENGFRLTRIEFARQKGASRLHALLKETEWVHSIKPEEADKLTPYELVSRFERALKERSVRLFYLYPYAKGKFEKKTTQLFQVLALLQKKKLLANHLPEKKREGNKVLGTLLFFLLTASLSFLLFPASLSFSSAFFLSILYALFPPASFPFSLLLLATSIFIPSALIFYFFPSKKNLYFPVCFLLLLASIVLHGTLSYPVYIERLSLFRGVKVALAFPFLFALLLPFLRSSFSSLRAFLQKPVTVGGMLLLGIIGLLLLFLWLRSGNEGVQATTGIELKIRLLLERLFFVRPRFKELFLGYPALYLFFKFRNKEKLSWALLALSAIGMASTVNTFCHLHAPLFVSILRTLYSQVLGALLGAFLFSFSRFFLKAGFRFL